VATDPSYGRRDFIKDSVRSVARAAREFSREADAPAPQKPAVVRRDWLRPPGAVDEARFLERCTQCGDCVKACPPGAIAAHERDATPVLFPGSSPCLLCDDFPCIAACQTGALLPIDGIHEVHMGMAVVSHRLCTAGQGCHACVSKCPTQALMMDFESMQLAVGRESCVGCGMCEMICNTVNDRAAIRIEPFGRAQGLTGDGRS